MPTEEIKEPVTLAEEPAKPAIEASPESVSTPVSEPEKPFSSPFAMPVIVKAAAPAADTPATPPVEKPAVDAPDSHVEKPKADAKIPAVVIATPPVAAPSPEPSKAAQPSEPPAVVKQPEPTTPPEPFFKPAPFQFTEAHKEAIADEDALRVIQEVSDHYLGEVAKLAERLNPLNQTVAALNNSAMQAQMANDFAVFDAAVDSIAEYADAFGTGHPKDNTPAFANRQALLDILPQVRQAALRVNPNASETDILRSAAFMIAGPPKAKEPETKKPDPIVEKLDAQRSQVLGKPTGSPTALGNSQRKADAIRSPFFLPKTP